MSRGYQQDWDETPYDVRPSGSAFSVDLDERVGAPLPSRRKSGLARLLVATLLVGGYWAVLTNNLASERLAPVVRSLIDTVVAKVQDIASRAGQDRAPAPEAAPAEQAAVLPPMLDVTPAQEETGASAAASEPVSTEALGAAYEEKAEPAEEAADKTPQRKKAVAAGLSPDLPNVLLSRLSKADFKNAAYAIETALAKTRDDATFSWPPSPSGQQALFEVRFVPGAAQGCRRYIVTVTKDRWTSTSAALEKCGTVHARAG
jgi:hypothetical protein